MDCFSSSFIRSSSLCTRRIDAATLRPVARATSEIPTVARTPVTLCCRQRVCLISIKLCPKFLVESKMKARRQLNESKMTAERQPCVGGASGSGDPLQRIAGADMQSHLLEGPGREQARQSTKKCNGRRAWQPHTATRFARAVAPMRAWSEWRAVLRSAASRRGGANSPASEDVGARETSSRAAERLRVSRREPQDTAKPRPEVP
jgi:hypothetical protein